MLAPGLSRGLDFSKHSAIKHYRSGIVTIPELSNGRLTDFVRDPDENTDSAQQYKIKAYKQDLRTVMPTERAYTDQAPQFPKIVAAHRAFR
jgi:hypothetical protein